MNALGMAAILVQALGWCLLHFIWQAAIVGLLYAVLCALLPRGKPRYFAAMFALVALAVIPAWTFWYELQALARPVGLGVMLVSPAGATSAADVADSHAGWFVILRGALPWLVLAWGCGVALLGLRVVRQYRGLRAIVLGAEALPAWQARAQRIGSCMGFGQVVRVLGSVKIATPTLVGWVRPVVLMPVAVLARMPVEQVDLILAHELAHLRRFDHVANLIQVVLETLFFYHPVVRWISRDARNERELCCDALALRATGGRRRDFVAALAGLEEFRAGHAALALAASGGVLVERAWFIAGTPPDDRQTRRSLAAALIALLCMAVVAGAVWRQNAARARVDAVLATNAGVLQRSLAMLTMQWPVSTWHAAIAQPPTLAPVAMARTLDVAQPAVAAPVPVVPVSRQSALMVPDLVALVPVHVGLAIRGVEKVQGDAARADAVTAPLRVLFTVQPVYPPQALLTGTQGLVEIQFALSAAGVPQNLRVVRASAAGQFDAAALLALSRWRFASPAEPGRLYRQTFSFRLGADEGAATEQSCLVATGTHICRRAFGAGPGTGTR